MFALALLTLVSCASPGETVLLDPAEAQKALIRMMDANPDCFAGFTPHLRKAAEGINLSNDGGKAFVGRIAVDRAARTYVFRNVSEHEGGRSATELVWQGRFVSGGDGRLEATTPTLTEERWIASGKGR